MSDALSKLWALSREVRHLQCVCEMLDYDAQREMPPLATAGRGEQSALLSAFVHKKLTGRELGVLLNEAAQMPEAAEFPNAQMLRCLKREYEVNSRVPAKFVMREANLCVKAQYAWEQAKKQNNFADFAPFLDEIFALKREYSTFFDYPHIYDALLNQYENGFSAVQVEEIMAELRSAQRNIIQSALAVQMPQGDVLCGKFSIKRQEKLSRMAAGILGFDRQQGVISTSEHPFTVTCGVHDVRITTKYFPDNLSSLFSTLHETGHALYEQNVAEAWIDTLPGAPQSLVLHESQSRLWENIVGRSPEFSACLFKILQKFFPRHFNQLEFSRFLSSVNQVRPSLIRTEADEATYNMHIMLRYELEVAMLKNELKAVDLPAVWREKMQEYLGVTPQNDTEGVLQDVHWACGLVGYFPTYLLGNLASAQIFAAAEKHLPDLHEELQQGETGSLRKFLIQNIYRFGGLYSAPEILQQVCGEPLSAQPYLTYLTNKFCR